MIKPDEGDNGMIVKILAGSTLVVGIVIALVIWLGGNETTKQADALYAQARDYCKKNLLAPCLAHVNDALNLKEKKEYYELKFNALYSDQRIYEAKAVLEKLLSYDPKNAHYYYLMNTIEQQDGNIDAVLNNLEKATELAPTNGVYQIAKATILVNLNRQKEAIPIYEKLIQEDPNHYHYWDQYALSYSSRQQFVQALTIRQQGLQANPNDFMQHFGIASLYDEMGKKQDAVKTYYRSLELRPLANSIAASRILELTGKRVPPELEQAVSDILPVTPNGKTLLLKADLNGEKGIFLLDTGASISAICKSKVARFKLKPVNAVLPIQTANGVIQSPLTYGNLRLGKHDINPAPFAVMPDPQQEVFDGIIGMNVLENFKFEINKTNHTLTLRN